jgi:hypothetical protein
LTDRELVAKLRALHARFRPARSYARGLSPGNKFSYWLASNEEGPGLVTTYLQASADFLYHTRSSIHARTKILFNAGLTSSLPLIPSDSGSFSHTLLKE